MKWTAFNVRGNADLRRAGADGGLQPLLESGPGGRGCAWRIALQHDAPCIAERNPDFLHEVFDQFDIAAAVVERQRLANRIFLNGIHRVLLVRLRAFRYTSLALQNAYSSDVHDRLIELLKAKRATEFR